MSAPTMGVEDLKRLLMELDVRREDCIEEWMENQGIDEEAMDYLGEKVSQAFIWGVKRENASPVPALYAVICAVFQIGWEASREYGRRP